MWVLEQMANSLPSQNPPFIVFLLVALTVQNLLFWGFLQNLSGCSSEGWVDPWETISLWTLLVFSQHSYMLTLRSWTSLQCNWGNGARHRVWTAGSKFEIKCLNSMSHLQIIMDLEHLKINIVGFMANWKRLLLESDSQVKPSENDCSGPSRKCWDWRLFHNHPPF